MLQVGTSERDLYGEERFGPISFVIACDDAADALHHATTDVRQFGGLTAFLYSTDESYIARAEDAYARAGAQLTINLTGAMPLNFAAAYSDYHVTGLNPAGNASLTDLAFVAICIAIVWKTSSFMALVLLAGMQTIPRSLYEAAEVDGATTWQQFWRITVPMLRPAIVVALIFRTITAIQTFDIPYAMTGGGPGDATETLAMYIHKTTLDFLDFGYGSALAAIMFLISMAATAVYLRHTRRESES
jgi:ABC-type sugar transport system permease subunit